jgi:hypothetical protein
VERASASSAPRAHRYRAFDHVQLVMLCALARCLHVLGYRQYKPGAWGHIVNSGRTRRRTRVGGRSYPSKTSNDVHPSIAVVGGFLPEHQTGKNSHHPDWISLSGVHSVA